MGWRTFRGRYFHTARWPSDLDITGKRVAVIGSGCTGYQLAAELANEVGHLYLFQRSPSWVFDVPGYLAPYPPQINWLDRNFPYLTNFIRFTGSFMNNPAGNRGQDHASTPTSTILTRSARSIERCEISGSTSCAPSSPTAPT